MPLSDPQPREPLHTREIVCRGYIRDDGLWDIEGHLTDTKAYSFENAVRREVKAGTPVHEMWVRLTIDDDMVIQTCEASTDHHPFPICPDVTPRFSELAGIRIGPGWMRHVRNIVGGVKGCTHIVEMLAQVGTTAYQTLVAKKRIKGGGHVGAGETQGGKKPMIIDSCHALASDGPVVKRAWPDWYTGPKTAAGGGE